MKRNYLDEIWAAQYKIQVRGMDVYRGQLTAPMKKALGILKSGEVEYMGADVWFTQATKDELAASKGQTGATILTGGAIGSGTILALAKRGLVTTLAKGDVLYACIPKVSV